MKTTKLSLSIVIAAACGISLSSSGCANQGDDLSSLEQLDAPKVPSHLVGGFYNVRNHGAKGDGKADDAPAIQDTIAEAAAHGGGIVLVPAGLYRLTKGLSLPIAVTLAGQGYKPTAAREDGSPGALVGSWLYVDARVGGASAITLSEPGATIRDIGIWHDQPAPGASFHPRAFGWAIDMPKPDTLVRNVWLENPTLGIRAIGRTTIENVGGEPLDTGIHVDTAYDVVRLRKVHINWADDNKPLWSSRPEVTSQLRTGIESFRNDNPEIFDVKISGYKTGFHYGASEAGITSKFAMRDTTISNAARCVTIDGANTSGKFYGLWLTNCGTGVWIPGDGAVISAANMSIEASANNAVRVEGSGAAFLVDQFKLKGWDQDHKGFPGIEAASQNAVAKIGVVRTTDGAKPFGGVGHVEIDSSGGDAALVPPIVAATEVPEDGVVPYYAKFDVKAYGARGDGTGDDAQAIQEALDAAAAGGGGPVVVPPGEYHLMTGNIRIPAGVELVGVGTTGQDGRAPDGSYLSVDASNHADIFEVGDHASLKNVGFRWDQPAFGTDFAPRDYGWGVRVVGVNAEVRDLMMLDPTRAIEVASQDRGPVLIDRIVGSPLLTGLHLDTNATVRANDFHFWPFGGFSIFGYALGHATAFEIDHTEGAEVSNAFSIGYLNGLLLGSNANGQVSHAFRLWNGDQDTGIHGYVIRGAGVDATFVNFSAQGQTKDSQPIGLSGLWFQPWAKDTTFAGVNGDFRVYTKGAIRSDDSPAHIGLDLMRIGGPAPATVGVIVGPESWGID